MEQELQKHKPRVTSPCSQIIYSVFTALPAQKFNMIVDLSSYAKQSDHIFKAVRWHSCVNV